VKKPNMIQRAQQKFIEYEIEIVGTAVAALIAGTTLAAVYFKGKSNGSQSYDVHFWTDGSHVTAFDPRNSEEQV